MADREGDTGLCADDPLVHQRDPEVAPWASLLETRGAACPGCGTTHFSDHPDGVRITFWCSQCEALQTEVCNPRFGEEEIDFALYMGTPPTVDKWVKYYRLLSNRPGACSHNRMSKLSPTEWICTRCSYTFNLEDKV